MVLMWSIVSHGWVRIMEGDVKDSSEYAKTTLLRWVNERIKTIAPELYRRIINFGTCWKDGLVLAALCNSIKSNLLDVNSLTQLAPYNRIEVCMATAEEQLSIPRLIEVCDFAEENPDERMIMVYISEFWRSELSKIGQTEFIPQKKGERLEVWLEEEQMQLVKQVQVAAEERAKIVGEMDKLMEQEDDARDSLEQLNASLREKQQIYKDMTDKVRYATPQQQVEIEQVLNECRAQIETLSRGIEEHVRQVQFLSSRVTEEKQHRSEVTERLNEFTTLYDERVAALRVLRGEAGPENEDATDDDEDDSDDEDAITQEEVKRELLRKMQEQNLDPSLLQTINVNATAGLAPIDERYLQMQREKDMITRMMKEQSVMIDKIKFDYQAQLEQQQREMESAKKQMMEQQLTLTPNVYGNMRDFAFEAQALLNKPLSGPTLKEGYFSKAGGKLALFRKRWFVLKQEGLYYFKTNKDLKKPQGVIPLSMVIDVLIVSEDDRKHSFLFNIISVKKTFPCKCETHDDLREWVSEIRKAVDRSKREAVKRTLPMKETRQLQPVAAQPAKPTLPQSLQPPPAGPLANAIYQADKQQAQTLASRTLQPQHLAPADAAPGQPPAIGTVGYGNAGLAALAKPGGVSSLGALSTPSMPFSSQYGGVQTPGLGQPGAPGLGGVQAAGLGGMQTPGLGAPQGAGLGGVQQPGLGGMQGGAVQAQNVNGLGMAPAAPASTLAAPQGIYGTQAEQLRALLAANPGLLSQLNPSVLQQLNIGIQ